MKSYRVTSHIKAFEQYFPLVVFIMLYSILPSILLVPVSGHLKNNFNFCDALINFGK